MHFSLFIYLRISTLDDVILKYINQRLQLDEWSGICDSGISGPLHLMSMIDFRLSVNFVYATISLKEGRTVVW